MARTSTQRETSAGGVAFREGPAGVEVALIRVGDPGRWQLPKGRIDPGETAEVAAVRETREEAGVDATLVRPLGVVGYWYVRGERGARIRIRKQVFFYLLRYTSGDVSDHDAEVDEAAWVPIREALARLAFPGEREVLERAIEALGAP